MVSTARSAPFDCSFRIRKLRSPPTGLRTISLSSGRMAKAPVSSVIFPSFWSMLLERRRRLEPVPPHAGFDLRDRRLDHRYAGVALRVTRDQVPGGARLDAGPGDHLLHGLVIGAALVAVSPVLVGQFPALQRVVPAPLEALELLVGRDVDPELDQHHPLVRQAALEVVDLAVGPVPLVTAPPPPPPPPPPPA